MLKPVLSAQDALADIPDGATVLIGGFGGAGNPVELIHALIDQGARDLTIVNNNAGNGDVGLAALIRERRGAKIICSFPRAASAHAFTEEYQAGRIELETVPQGTLAERIRAGGAGVPAFYTRTSVGTPLAEGKEIRAFDGRDYVMEHAITGDYALVKCLRADRMGNLTYSKSARNFAPIMCMAAKCAVVQTVELVEPGAIDPETVVTPGIFTGRIVHTPDAVQEQVLFEQGARYPCPPQPTPPQPPSRRRSA
ncbi:MAG: 3-oxoadipate CoA-transferase [Rhodobacteraceae bacterium]|nr:3-oxoadipate CoA-transferase [Paracoccaceae bacterium]